MRSSSTSTSQPSRRSGCTPSSTAQLVKRISPIVLSPHGGCRFLLPPMAAALKPAGPTRYKHADAAGPGKPGPDDDGSAPGSGISARRDVPEDRHRHLDQALEVAAEGDRRVDLADRDERQELDRAQLDLLGDAAPAGGVG